MGKTQTGKSVIIRSLTGVSKRQRKWEIRTKEDGDINICVLVRSLQEEDKIQTVNELLEWCENCENILLALRLGGRTRVKGYKHIREFIEKRHSISPIVVLAKGEEQQEIRKELQKIGVPQGNIEFFEPKAIPTNAIAAKIRKKWRWK